MWVIAQFTPSVQMPEQLRVWLAAALAVAGFATAASGVALFTRAHTTIHPDSPQKTSTLVTSGVYRLTRNPMYLGLALLLIGWAVWLTSLLALVGVAVFVLYIYRFQIRPEERVLATKFPAEYPAYQARVRRWL
jgi:protein-S-isoprenylcysteine O-methyltransferase Ste14